MPSAHHSVELANRNSHHQVASHDPAAHSTLAEERETPEHPSFSDISPCSEYLSNALRELLVVGHEDPRLALLIVD